VSWLGDVLDFEKFNGGKIFGGIAKDPSRLVTGVDPASTGFWNAILGTHKHALVDQMGGARGETYKEAKDAGINTGPGRFMQNVAHVVAGAEALGGLAGAGGAGSAAGAAPAEGGGQFVFNPAVDSQLANVSEGIAPAAGGSAVADPAGLAALDSQAVDAEGAEPGLTQSFGHTTTNGSMYGQRVQQLGKLMQQQAQERQQRELEQSRVAVDTPALQNPYATSSRSAKTGPSMSATALVARAGQPGAEPVDANGAEMASIQALTKELQAAQARLEALEGKRK